MSESKENIVLEDIYSILKTVHLKELENKTVFITGATGLIGSLLTKALLTYNLRAEHKINVIVMVRNEEKARRVFTAYQTEENFKYYVHDATNAISIDCAVDYMIHCACTTSSKEMVNAPVDTIDGIVNGTKNVLDFAHRKQCKSIVHLSSIEVYGMILDDQQEVQERDYGYIDILSPRSSYSEGKRLAENLCIAYHKQYDVSVKIARLTQTFGAGVSNDDERVFAQFLKSSLNQEDIVFRTTGESSKSYCYTADAVAAILTLLLHGQNGESYNIANKDTYCSILKVAEIMVELVREKFQLSTQIRFDLNADASVFNPITKLKLNTNKIEALGWKASYGLEEMFERTIKSWRPFG